MNSINPSRIAPEKRSSEKPPDGWVKINVDVAFFEDTNCIGVGSVARDAGQDFVT